MVSTGPQAGASGLLPAAGTPTPTPTPTDVGAVPLFPNLGVLRAFDVRIAVRDGRRVLQFSSTLSNIGVGPMEVVPGAGKGCARGQRRVDQAVYQDENGNGRYDKALDRRRVLRKSGCMSYHPTHTTGT